MKVLGLTGGIGSGKSTIAKIFTSLNVPVFNSDIEAKAMYEDSEILKELSKLFGTSILLKDNSLNKEKLASIVFSDEKKLKMLTNFIHPKVTQRFNAFLEESSMFNYVVKEAAILIESGAYVSCDKILLVVSSLEEKMQRVKHRDNTSEDQIKARMSKQMTDEEKRPYVDFTINNSTSTKNSLIKEVLEIHSFMMI